MKTKSAKKTEATAAAVAGRMDPTALHTLIEKKAYELFEKRGYQHGRHHEDWMEAERIVTSQLEPISELGPKQATLRTQDPVVARRQITHR
jgi:DUF2934 family protein